MGCVGSKKAGGADDDVAVAADVYCPPPTSVSLFDISAVEEPWLIAKTNKDADEEGDGAEEEEDDDEEEETDDEGEDEKKTTTVVPLPLLDKLEGYELAPASWSEVSKALEDMKPALDSKRLINYTPPAPNKTKTKKKKTTKTKEQQEKTPPPEAKAAAAAAQPTTTTQPSADDEAAAKNQQQASSAANNNESKQQDDVDETKPPPPELAGRRIVKDNPFLMRDRENKQGAPASPRWRRRDPFEGCPERRPPGASGGGVVLYTTTLRGVRRTFDACERAREAVEACAEAAGVPAVDERDVSLHGEYLRELRELAGEGAAPPRLFVMGRYVGGAEEVTLLSESGKLREMMRWAKARGEACAAKDGRGCMGCGGARFVPCWECGGGCKVVVDGQVQRCGKCNENGLMMCPICH